MGKSPGKWIKTVLFGKKSSKSNLSKGSVILKSASEKTALVSAKAPASDLAVEPLSILQPVPVPVPGTSTRIKENSEKGASTKLPNDVVDLSSERQGGDGQTTTNLDSLRDSQRWRLEQAAIKAQATFRGYLARRAFRALKGIIRLQALIRGHLVRRQAVATLYCLEGIVKFQAFVRGQKVRRSDIGNEVHKKQNLVKLDAKCLDSCKINRSTRREKLLKNAFVCKLISSSPTAMPLHLQHDRGEPNSAWNWLLRWTQSHIWGPDSQPKKITDSKQDSFQTVETEQVRPKRGVQRLPAANVDNGSNHSISESEKFKRNMRRVTNHPVRSVQEHPKNEIEKVKHNLKKISNPTMETSVQQEGDTEKPSHIHKKSSNAPAPDSSEHGIDVVSKKVVKDIDSAVSNAETSPKLPATDGPVSELHDHPTLDLQPQQINGRNEDVPVIDKDSDSKDDRVGNENQKTSRRRASLPAKHDFQENGLHNTPRVPSYMAATESAKAKLRGQGSPRFGQDGAEKNGLTRRHSLPSSTNVKLSSSPRVQRLVQSSGKGGIRSERSLTTSRDGNVSEKVIQAEWRR